MAALLAVPAAAQELKTDEQQALYLLGASLGQRVGEFGLSAKDLPYVKQGLEDMVLGAKLKVDPQAVNPKLQALAEKRITERAAKEKAKGKEYAQKAAKEKGAQQLPSGLILIPLKEGKGAFPVASDTVKVHYKGTFTDGSEFDSSYKRNQPAEFALNGVIPCWTEALQKVKVGGKAKLICPSDIAYGDQGRPSIPGGATLVFEVELLDIIKQAGTGSGSTKDKN